MNGELRLNVFSKKIYVWLILATTLIVGSMLISIQGVNDSLINLNVDNTQRTGVTPQTASPSPASNTINSNSIEIDCSQYAEVCTQNVPNTPGQFNAPHVVAIAESEDSAISAISNSIVIIEHRPVAKFDLQVKFGIDDAWFSIANDSEQPQLFLVKATATPDVPFSIESNNDGSRIMYHEMGKDKWLVEVKSGGGTLLINKARGSFVDNVDELPLVVHVEVRKELELDQHNRNVLSDSVQVFGPKNVSIGYIDIPTTRFEVVESGSTHLTWGIQNDSSQTRVYLIRLDTVPELWINLEILERTLDRVYQRTDEGYFFVGVEPGDVGMSFSAVSGPENYKMLVEVTQVI